jgi:hypothetical protein
MRYRDLFFYRNYLFIEDLLTVSRFPHTLTLKIVRMSEFKSFQIEIETVNDEF